MYAFKNKKDNKNYSKYNVKIMNIIDMTLVNRSIDKQRKCMEKSQTKIERQTKKKKQQQFE